MRILFASFFISIPIVYSIPINSDLNSSNEVITRTKRSVFSDLFTSGSIQWRLSMFLLLYAFFVILSAVVFLFYRYYNARRKTREEPPPVKTPELSSLIGESMESIAEIEDESRSLNNELATDQEPKIEIPQEELSLPIRERIQYIRYDQSYEIERKNLKREGKQLGSGHFGLVFPGVLKKSHLSWKDETPLKVALKMAQNKYNEALEKMVYDEIKLMSEIGKHPNVLAIVGAITPKIGKTQLSVIITEFVDCGDLLKFLQDRENIFLDKLKNTKAGYEIPKNSKLFGKKEELPMIEDSLESLSTFDLLSFAYQIANGMEYLTRINLVHRDLALRNILINSKKIIRIADFGLARQYNGREYYKITTESTQLPAYYMAPESFNSHKFSEKSDVWSYGVCLYEIFSLGGKLYEGVGDLQKYLADGNRLEKPRYCHNDIYRFMRLCWCLDPNARPQFSKCLSFFGTHLRESTNQLLRNIETKLHEEARIQRELDNWTRRGNDEEQEN